MEKRFALGQHVRALGDWPIRRIYSNGYVKIADIEHGELAIVTGHDGDKTIFNIVRYQIIVTLEEYLWEATDETGND